MLSTRQEISMLRNNSPNRLGCPESNTRRFIRLFTSGVVFAVKLAFGVCGAASIKNFQACVVVSDQDFPSASVVAVSSMGHLILVERNVWGWDGNNLRDDKNKFKHFFFAGDSLLDT